MWIWILVAVVVVAALVYAFWPRKKGISDDAVLDLRQGSHGSVEGRHNSNRTQWPF